MYVGIDVEGFVNSEFQGEQDVISMEKEIVSVVEKNIYKKWGDYEVLVSSSKSLNGSKVISAYVYGVDTEVWMPGISSALKALLPKYVDEDSIKVKEFIDNDIEDSDEITGLWENVDWTI